MFKADEVRVVRNESKKYSLLKLDYNGCVRFAIYVGRDGESEMEVVGCDCNAAEKLFALSLSILTASISLTSFRITGAS